MITIRTINGIFIVGVEQLKIFQGEILDIEDKRKEIPEFFKKEISNLTDSYFYTEAKARGGYLNMGEIYVDAQENDPDAKFLLKLYDAIWEKEEELESRINSMNLEELLNLDIKKLVKESYDPIKESLETATESESTSTEE